LPSSMTRTCWPSQLWKDLVLRDASGAGPAAPIPDPAPTPLSCHLVPLLSGLTAGSRICTNLSVTFLRSSTCAAHLSLGDCPRSAPVRPPFRPNPGANSEGTQAGDGFAEPPLLALFWGLKVSPGDKQPPSSRH